MAKGVQLKQSGENIYPNNFYEVGDVYITTRTENPSTRFGGTWELLCPGRTLVCIDNSDSGFSTIKQTGGSKNHSHQYGIQYSTLYGLPYGQDARVIRVYNGTSGSWATLSRNGNTNETGNNGVQERYGSAFNCAQYQVITNTTNTSSLMPYMAVCIWVRTA